MAEKDLKKELQDFILNDIRALIKYEKNLDAAMDSNMATSLALSEEVVKLKDKDHDKLKKLLTGINEMNQYYPLLAIEQTKTFVEVRSLYTLAISFGIDIREAIKDPNELFGGTDIDILNAMIDDESSKKLFAFESNGSFKIVNEDIQKTIKKSSELQINNSDLKKLYNNIVRDYNDYQARVAEQNKRDVQG